MFDNFIGNTAFKQYQVLTDLNIETLFSTLKRDEDLLLNQYEDDVSKIFEFMEHDQRRVYDTCKKFLQDNSANIRHFNTQKLAELEDILGDKHVYKLAKLPRATALKKEIEDEFIPMLQSARETALSKLDEIITTLQNDEKFAKVPTDSRYLVIRPIQQIQEQIKKAVAIDTIAAMGSDASLLSKGLERIEELLPEDEPKLTIKRIMLDKIAPKGKRLKNAEDVEQYIETLKRTLLEAIDNNTEILS